MRDSGHRDVKTTVKTEGGRAYPFLDCEINLQDWVLRVYCLWGLVSSG